MSASKIISAYYKNEAGKIIEPIVSYHTGTFSDSVLVTCSEEVDFRYFPKGFFGEIIAPYHWSDGLKQITIQSVGENVVFRGSEQEFVCESGNTITIKSEEYWGDGLISPDSVNGKCALTNIEESGDK